jgi:hypothetical protein
MKQRSLWFKALLILLPILLGLEILLWVSLLPRMVRGGSDFRQLYVAGTMVRRGEAASLYDYGAQSRLQHELISPKEDAIPFLRPAYQALLFAPFTLLSFRGAYLLWTALNAVLAAAICFLLRRQFPGLEEAGKLLPTLVICAYFPIWVALLQGQDTILLLLLLAAALLALNGDREFLAGALLACGLFKFQIILPIAFLFVLWKRWRFARGFFAAAAVLAGLSFALVGTRGIGSFVASLLHVHYPVRYETMCNLHALLVGLLGNSLPVTLATIVLSVLAWLAVARWSPAKRGPNALMIAIPAAALVSYYLFPHDWSVMIFPILFALEQGSSKSGWVGLLAFVSPLLYVVAEPYMFLAVVPMIALLVVLAREIARGEAAACAIPERQPLEAASGRTSGPGQAAPKGRIGKCHDFEERPPSRTRRFPLSATMALPGGRWRIVTSSETHFQ